MNAELRRRADDLRAAWPISGGRFDIAGKLSARKAARRPQGEPGFWDNQDRARGVIGRSRA